MVLCEYCLGRRHNRRKTYTSLWDLRNRGCPNNLLKSRQWLASILLTYIFSILSASWTHFACGTSQWILILRMRHPILQVLATAPGNQPAVWVWTGKTIRFGSSPVQQSELLCVSWFDTLTGHKPTVVWPGLSYSRASFSRTQNFASNYVFQLRSYHNMIYT